MIKFVLVGSWFMHLKFDSQLFRMLFITGIVIALLVFTVMLVALRVARGRGPRSDQPGVAS